MQALYVNYTNRVNSTRNSKIICQNCLFSTVSIVLEHLRIFSKQTVFLAIRADETHIAQNCEVT